MLIRMARIEDAEEIAHIYVDGWKNTYKGIVSQDILDNMSYTLQCNRWRDVLASNSGYMYVVENADDKVIGFIWGGLAEHSEEQYKGEIHAIYLQKDYQGQRIGRLLVSTLIQQLLQDGVSSLIVWVIAANRARSFYEGLGGKLVRERIYTTNGATLPEVAYGWQDMRMLISI